MMRNWEMYHRFSRKQVYSIVSCFWIALLLVGLILLFSSPLEMEADRDRLPGFDSQSTECNTQDVDFYDCFDGDELDVSKWLFARKQWGGDNNGIVPENVKVSNGTLKLEAHGDLYTGNVKGVYKTGSQTYEETDKGNRVGAGIATADYFASGSYQMRMRIAPVFGVYNTMWTFHYQYLEPDPINHEIDIELPAKVPNPQDPFQYALYNTYRNEHPYTSNRVNIGPQNDGNFHIYRFDWHTGGTGGVPRVEFYQDGKLMDTIFTNVPNLMSRLWIAIWFPGGAPGTPNFDTSVMEVDWVTIKKFNEANDNFTPEPYPYDGLVLVPPNS